jgi:hypothetical protein
MGLIPLRLALLAVALPAAAKPTPAEQFLRDTVARGETADFTDRPEADRVVSAAFVRDLLAQDGANAGTLRREVRVRGCTVADTVDLRNRLIDCEVLFEACEFKGGLDLKGATFARDLSIVRSHVGRVSGERLVVKGSLDLSDSRFGGPFSLRFVSVSGYVDASGAEFQGETSFSTGRVEGNLNVSRAAFKGAVDFIALSVAGQFLGTSAAFGPERPSANSQPAEQSPGGAPFDEQASRAACDNDFYSLTVGHDCVLDDATFRGSTRCRLLKIGSDLSLRRANFGGDADFGAASIGGEALIQDAQFEGLADFSRVQIGHLLNGDGARFKGSTSFDTVEVKGIVSLAGCNFFDRLSFNGATLRKSVVLTGTSVSGGVDFTAAEVLGQLRLDDARFDRAGTGAATRPTGVAPDATPDQPGARTQPAATQPAESAPSDSGPPDTLPAAESTAATQPVESDFDNEFYSLKVGGLLSLDGASFAGSADFRLLKVASDLTMNQATFSGPVDFSDATVVGKTKFVATHFGARADFDRLKVGGPVDAYETTFGGTAGFNAAQVEGDFDIGRCTFEGATRFVGLKVGGGIFASRSRFLYGQRLKPIPRTDTQAGGTGPAATALANDQPASTLPGETQPGETQPATGRAETAGDSGQSTGADFDHDFYSMVVAGNCIFHDAAFTGTVDLRRAHITGLLSATGAMFEREVNAGGMRVDSNLYIDQCVFLGPVSLVSASAGGTFNARDTKFQPNGPPAVLTPRESERDTDFYSMSVGRHCFLDGAMFGGTADLRLLKAGSGYSLNRARFVGKAELEDAYAGGEVSLIDVRFEGPVSFVRFRALGPVQLAQGVFEQAADFSGMWTDGLVSLDAARFQGPVTFAGAKFGGALWFEGAVVEWDGTGGADASLAQGADFSGITIGQGASFTGTEFRCGVDFHGTNVSGNFVLSNTRFMSSTQDATFDELTVGKRIVFDGAAFTRPPHLAMSYHDISAATTAGQPRDELRALLASAHYTPVAYMRLEEYFHRTGQPSWASDVYVDRQWRERRERLPWWSPQWWGNMALYALVRYGRTPALAFAWSAGVVLVGMLVFQRKKMRPKPSFATLSAVPPDPYRDYHPLLYSIDLFLPVVGLKTDEAWAPDRQYKGLLVYMRIHKLLGWILIPLALAAITGLVR